MQSIDLTSDRMSWAVIRGPGTASITYDHEASGVGNIYVQAADGSGSAERLTISERPQSPSSWLSDGPLLAFVSQGDIYILRMRDRKAEPWLNTRFLEGYPTFSPDGRWLAYSSNETGQMEVYVRPFPGPGPQHSISTKGGMEPLWAPDGRELFCRQTRPADQRKVMAVDVKTEPTFMAGAPHALFDDTPFMWANPVRS